MRVRTPRRGSGEGVDVGEHGYGVPVGRTPGLSVALIGALLRSARESSATDYALRRPRGSRSGRPGRGAEGRRGRTLPAGPLRRCRGRGRCRVPRSVSCPRRALCEARVNHGSVASSAADQKATPSSRSSQDRLGFASCAGERPRVLAGVDVVAGDRVDERGVEHPDELPRARHKPVVSQAQVVDDGPHADCRSTLGPTPD
jgi:hypothetical protein